MDTATFSGTMAFPINTLKPLSPPQYDGLPDTPVEDIKWELMGGFCEHRSGTHFSYGGKTWWCASGQTHFRLTGTYLNESGQHEFWAIASPYIFGNCNSRLARSQEIRVHGFATEEEAQKALIEVICDRKLPPVDLPPIKTSINVGSLNVTRHDLAKIVSDIAQNIKLLHEVDKAALAWLVQKAQEDVAVEVGRPTDWKFCEVNVTPIEEVSEGDTWVKISLKEKVEVQS